MFTRIKKSIIEKINITKMKWIYNNRPLTSTEARRRRELFNSEGFLKWLHKENDENGNKK